MVQTESGVQRRQRGHFLKALALTRNSSLFQLNLMAMNPAPARFAAYSWHDFA